MTWQKVARIGVVLVGVSFAVMLVVYSRDRAVPSPPTPEVPTDPDASSETGAGTTTRLRGSDREVVIEYARSQSYSDGRVRFEQGHVTFGTGEQVWADEIVLTGRALSADEPSRYELRGNVRLIEEGRLSIETAEATYDDVSGILTIPGPLTFVRGPMTGSGTGATYNQALDTFRLHADARARIEAAEDGTGGVDASAESMSLARVQNYLRLAREARLERESETLVADVMTINFLEDGSTVRFMELRGHARVDPKPDGASATPSMAADDITLGFYPDNATLQHATLTGSAILGLPSTEGRRSVAGTWIDLYLATDGATVTRLEGRNQVVVTLAADASAGPRTIRAARLVGEGTERDGLQSARFDGDVEYLEQPPAGGGDQAEERRATSDVLVLALNGGLDDIDQAEFQGSMTFTSGEVTATAPLGRYDSSADTLALRSSSGSATGMPRVENQRMTVEAREIDLSMGTDDLAGRGSVSTVTISGTAIEPSESHGLFQGDEPVYGTADSLDYSGVDGRAVYQGTADLPARLVQGRERVSADEIIVEEASENLWASGRVETLFSTRPDPESTSGPAEGDPIDYRITAETFTYESVLSRATYEGAPVTMETVEGQTIAARLVARLSEATRAIEGFEATGDVYSELGGGHEAKGDVLIYEADTGTYTLTRSPAQAKSPNEEGTGCMLSKGVRVVFTPGSGASWQAPGGPLAQTQEISCLVSIR